MMNFEQAQRVSSSQEWELIKNELEFRIDVYLSQLRTCDMEDLSATQLRIKVYEEIKRLPEDCKEREEDIKKK